MNFEVSKAFEVQVETVITLKTDLSAQGIKAGAGSEKPYE